MNLYSSEAKRKVSNYKKVSGFFNSNFIRKNFKNKRLKLGFFSVNLIFLFTNFGENAKINS